MSKLQGEILTLPKMSGSVSSPSTLGGNIGAKTINIGEDGATFIPSVSSDGVISWTNDKNMPNPEPVNIKGVKGDKGDKGDRGLQGVQGVQGIQGERGEQGQKGDKGDRGEQGIQGVQGAKGETGAQGQKGADGTPATHRWSGTTLYITSASGTSSANLKGEKGDRGDAGASGTNGFSPTVAVSNISGGHRVSITDKNGTKNFDVLDGAKGDKGDKGETGANGKDGKTPEKGVDYFTEADKAEMVSAVISALPVYDGSVTAV